jgi:molybdate transport system substrate-binding protein
MKSMPRPARFIPLLLLFGSAAYAADLLVAAASDLAPLISALQSTFTRQTGISVRFTLASSGSLARQIQNGAPFDVYLSASEQYVQELARNGLVEPSTESVYALGRLALWSQSGSIHSLEDLAKPGVQHLAIPNPEHAPYGVAAKQALERRGLWGKVAPKAVYAENVRQALQYAESGNADAVITSWTLLKGRGQLLPAEWSDPIRQTGAVVKQSGQQHSARRFLAFLSSPEGRKLLQEYGLFEP